MNALTVIVVCLVVYRLTLLVVADKITEPIRDRITSRYVHPAHEKVVLYEVGHREHPDGLIVCRCGQRFTAAPNADWMDLLGVANDHVNEHNRGGVELTEGPRWLILIDCPWCASWWISLPVSWSAWCFAERAWWMIPAVAFAASGVTGFAAKYASPDD